MSGEQRYLGLKILGDMGRELENEEGNYCPEANLSGTS